MVLIDQFYGYMQMFYTLREQHGLFLDLEDKDIADKYTVTYPEGGSSLDFLFMICRMTKDKNIFKNKVVRNKIKSLR